MGYSRRTSHYPKRVILFDPTQKISMVDLVSIGMKILKIDGVCSLKK